MNLPEYISKGGRGAATSLAKSINAPASVMSCWISGKRPIPPGRCIAIEQATQGLVTRKELRADWQTFWPELA